MQSDESFMVYALLVPGRIALATIGGLCCLHLCECPLSFKAFGRHYPVLSGLVPSCLVVRRQGFGSHIQVTQDPLCDLSLVG